MLSSRAFQIAFIFSLAIHGTILLRDTRLAIFSRQKTEPGLEISYIDPPQLKKDISAQKSAAPRELLLKIPAKETTVKKILALSENKINLTLRDKTPFPGAAAFAKPALIKPDIIAVKKKITLPALDIEKINNPSYISYYQIVREKIKRCAYQNYSRSEVGEVYLSFIIAAEGTLREVRLAEDKSSQNSYLKGIASRSIKDAAPFPAFPKDLDYPQLSFNIVISFEIE